MWRSQAPKKHEFTAIKLNSIDAKLSLERSHHHHTRRFLLFHAVLFEFRQSRNLSLCEICSTEVELEQLFNKLAFGQAPGWGKELHRLHISPWVRRPPRWTFRETNTVRIVCEAAIFQPLIAVINYGTDVVFGKRARSATELFFGLLCKCLIWQNG